MKLHCLLNGETGLGKEQSDF